MLLYLVAAVNPALREQTCTFDVLLTMYLVAAVNPALREQTCTFDAEDCRMFATEIRNLATAFLDLTTN